MFYLVASCHRDNSPTTLATDTVMTKALFTAKELSELTLPSDARPPRQLRASDDMSILRTDTEQKKTLSEAIVPILVEQ